MPDSITGRTSSSSEEERPLSRGGAVEALARRLYWNMQRLDPDLDAPDDWEALTEKEKHFYEELVDDLICFDRWIKIAQNG